MKRTVDKKIYAIFVILLLTASIFMILSGAVAENDAGLDTQCRKSTRASPTIEKVGTKTVVNDQVTINGNEDQWINLTVIATDPDTAQLIFQDDTDLFDIKYDGKDGDNSIGNITFLPTNSEVGTFNVTIMVKEFGGPGKHEVEIEFVIANTNDLPYLNPINDISIKQDEWGKVTITATDDDGIHIKDVNEKLTFYNNISYSGMDIKEGINYHFTTSHSTGEKTWSASFQFKPDNTMVGKYSIRFSVEDSKKENMRRYVNLTVLNVNDPPETPQILNPTKSVFDSNTAIVFKGDCDDPDLHITGSTEVLNYTWKTTFNDETTVIGYGAEITRSDLSIGNHTITLEVADSATNISSTSMSLRIKALFDLTATDAEKYFEDEKLDLLEFSSEDGVKFEADFSQDHPWVDITELESKLEGVELVITLTFQGNIKNATGINYYVYIVRDTHTEQALDLSSDALPEFYKPPDELTWYTFEFKGGQGFVNKIGKDESHRIYDGKKLEFRIKVKYLEDLGMPTDFGIFARALYSTDTGALTGPYVFTYDGIGTGNVTSEPPPPYKDPDEAESILDQPFIRAILALIVIIILIIIAYVIVMKRREQKELTAPPSFDYKFVSGFEDQEQYETLYGTSKTKTDSMPPPMMPMPPQMPPGGVPPGGPMAAPQAGKAAGTACPKCGKAIVVGMSKCPHCNSPL